MRRPAPIALGAFMLLAAGCAHYPTPAELLRKAPSRPAAIPYSSQQEPIIQVSAQNTAKDAVSTDDPKP